MSMWSVDRIYQAVIASYIASAPASPDSSPRSADDLALTPLERIRRHFKLMDVTSSRKLSANDVTNHWINSITHPTESEIELIALEVDKFIQVADLNKDGFVSENEYIHYILLQIQEREPGRREEIGLLLNKKNEDIDEYVDLFLSYDTKGNGFITVEDLRTMLANVHKLSESKIDEILSIYGNFELINYCDFILILFGRFRSRISILYYDISGSATKALSRLLFGRKIEGIWHTSVLAFGFEWWYGGDCFQSKPLTTPFGSSPTRIEHVGETTKSITELQNFIRNKMRSKFNYLSYDVIYNNCNNFSNNLLNFLIYKNLNTTVLNLPSTLLSGGIARVFRPFLNKWLGNFHNSDKIQDDVMDAIRDERMREDGGGEGFKKGEIAIWKKKDNLQIFCEVLDNNKIKIINSKKKFKIVKLRENEFKQNLSKINLKEETNRINYFIALSILQNHIRNPGPRKLRKDIKRDIIGSLIASEASRQGSMISVTTSDDQPKGCFKRCLFKCLPGKLFRKLFKKTKNRLK
jgi:Ca2+-binding EF-hand superfamily protein